MFKVTSKGNGNTETIYAVESKADDCSSIWFLVFVNDVWQWKNSNLFIPVNS